MHFETTQSAPDMVVKQGIKGAMFVKRPTIRSIASYLLDTRGSMMKSIKVKTMVGSELEVLKKAIGTMIRGLGDAQMPHDLMNSLTRHCSTIPVILHC